MKAKIGTYVGLLIVTGLALMVAITVTASGWRRTASSEGEKPERVIPQTPVSVMRVQLESIEITDSYSGMVRPRERFSLGFEIAGRVSEFGTKEEWKPPDEGAGAKTAKKPLDEGDRVTADQVLARLDDRILSAQLEEAKARVKECNARLEKAQSDLVRSKELRQRGSRVITEAEYQNDVTQLAVAVAQLAVAKAQLETALKNLSNSTLVSPVSGVISKRLVEVGESVNPHQVILEIIQVDEVLLVVGVPEAYVGEIRVGQLVHVELLARDRFRRKRPARDGRVHQVAEAADQTTGLFEVEILLPNPQRRWKPGLIALARIVVDRVQGFRIPMTCAVFRQEETFLFLFDEVAKDGKAHRFDLQDWIEEGSDLVIPVTSDAFRHGKPFLFSLDQRGNPQRFDLQDRLAEGSDGIPPELPDVYWTVVSRGQHRLVDGRKVKLVRLDDGKPVQTESQPLVRPAAPVAGSEP